PRDLQRPQHRDHRQPVDPFRVDGEQDRGQQPVQHPGGPVGGHRISSAGTVCSPPPSADPTISSTSGPTAIARGPCTAATVCSTTSSPVAIDTPTTVSSPVSASQYRPRTES